jgi:Tfp pilus assembly protein PilO
VLSLFSSEQTLDTLLFDISNIASAKKVKLTSFQPKAGGAMAIEDSSLGQEVNGKLKRETISVEMTGSFENTQAFMRDLERLQPLLLMKNINFSIKPEDLVGTVYVDAQKKTARVVPQPPNNLKTTFTLEAILPLSPEEMKEIAAKKEAESKNKK